MTKEELLIENFEKDPGICYMYDEDNAFIDSNELAFEAIFNAMEQYKDQEQSELQEKYNNTVNSLIYDNDLLQCKYLNMAESNNKLSEKYNKLEKAYRSLLEEHIEFVAGEHGKDEDMDNKYRKMNLEAAGLKEQ